MMQHAACGLASMLRGMLRLHSCSAVRSAVASMHVAWCIQLAQCCSAPARRLAAQGSRQRCPVAAPTCSNACQLPPRLYVMQLSKEVRALRTHEAALLAGYHTYLKALLQVGGLGWPGMLAELAPVALAAAEGALPLPLPAKARGLFIYCWFHLQAYKGSNGGQAPLQQGRIAVKCMAGLLEAAPHFNYRSGEGPECACRWVGWQPSGVAFAGMPMMRMLFKHGNPLWLWPAPACRPAASAGGVPAAQGPAD